MSTSHALALYDPRFNSLNRPALKTSPLYRSGIVFERLEPRRVLSADGAALLEPDAGLTDEAAVLVDATAEETELTTVDDSSAGEWQITVDGEIPVEWVIRTLSHEPEAAEVDEADAGLPLDEAPGELDDPNVIFYSMAGGAGGDDALIDGDVELDLGEIEPGWPDDPQPNWRGLEETPEVDAGTEGEPADNLADGGEEILYFTAGGAVPEAAQSGGAAEAAGGLGGAPASVPAAATTADAGLFALLGKRDEGALAPGDSALSFLK